MTGPSQSRFRNYGAIKPVEGENGTHSGRRQIGLISATFIIFNSVVGAGIFATPSTILRSSGSVGLALIMWVIGGITAAVGMQVYIVWGTALPVNGGEKNYLEYLFRRPKYLITFVYAVNAVLLGQTTSTAIVFGEYTLRALNRDPTHWQLRLVGLACITFCLLLHGTALKWGLRLQNILGVFKIIILVFVIITGFLALGGHMKVDKPHNFQNVFDGTTASASSFCSGLYNVIWSYYGFSNINYVLSEVKNPERTVRVAGLVAIAATTVLYILANIAYFAGATKQEIATSGQLVAALLFRNVYGPQAERALDVFIAVSSLGGTLSGIFCHGRLNQALGQEGTLPLSNFWASNRPFNAPLAGMFLHCLVCVTIIFALPPGDAYDFVINFISYPVSVINAVISFGIVYLSLWPYDGWPTVSVPAQSAAIFFGAGNVFLFVAPFVPPPTGHQPYMNLPYWSHAVAGWAIFGIGFLYWLVWVHLLPQIGGYTLVRSEEVTTEGLTRRKFKRIPLLVE